MSCVRKNAEGMVLASAPMSLRHGANRSKRLACHGLPRTTQNMPGRNRSVENLRQSALQGVERRSDRKLGFLCRCVRSSPESHRRHGRRPRTSATSSSTSTPWPAPIKLSDISLLFIPPGAPLSVRLWQAYGKAAAATTHPALTSTSGPMPTA